MVNKTKDGDEHANVISKTAKKVIKMRLSDLSKGESAIIDSFTNEGTKLKLMEMGCLPGEKIKVSRHAPLGCPVAIKVANYTLSLRMEEAQTIIVVKYE
ncbi:MAG: FeoA family protein [Bacteroidia bacterium]